MNPSTDHIDKYLRNELSGKELKAFESRLATDPSLQEQLDFDQLVADGLKEVRKAELKSRLDAIDVTSPLSMGHFSNSYLVKSIGVIITASIVGVAAYYYFSGSKEDNFLTGNSDYPQYIEQPQLDPEEITEALEQFETEIVENEVVTVEHSEPIELKKSSVQNVDIESDFSPQVSVPTLGDLEEEDLAENELDFEAPQNAELNITEPLAGEVIDVVFEDANEKGALEYKYFDGKLFLYGDFKGIPYELLEINRSAQKLVYLFHNNVYYQIAISDEVQELEAIQESSLLNELEILRNNKQ